MCLKVNLDYLNGFQCIQIEMIIQFIFTEVRRVTIICDSIAKIYLELMDAGSAHSQVIP